MTPGRGESQPYRLLDDFICQAIPSPSILDSQAFSSPVARGENEAVRLVDEPAASPCQSEAELRAMSLASLLEVVTSGPLDQGQRALVRQIAQERLKSSRAEAALAEQLIARCGDGSQA